MDAFEFATAVGKILVGVGVAFGMLAIGVLSAAWSGWSSATVLAALGTVLVSSGIGIAIWDRYVRHSDVLSDTR